MGSKESNIGKGILYATPHFGKIRSKEKPHYDFVEVFIHDDNNSGDNVVLAQIISFIELENPSKDKWKYYAIVQYLRKVSNTNHNHGMPIYQWEYLANNKFNIDMIDIESIARPAFVVPYFSNKHEVKMGNSRKNDKFQFLPFNFFDRSGWESLTDQLHIAIVDNQNDITNSLNGESNDDDNSDHIRIR